MGGKTKGGNFEREICKLLSLWWTRDDKIPQSDVFWRATNSGARATVRAAKGQTTANSYGDVTFIHVVGAPLLDACTLELKVGYGDWCIMDVLDAPEIKGKIAKQTFEKFWEQARNDSVKAGGKEPLLITRKDRRKACITMRESFYARAKNLYGDPAKSMLSLHMQGETLIVLTLNDFLNWISPEMFKGVTRKRRNPA